jgi:hypothetical protein
VKKYNQNEINENLTEILTYNQNSRQDKTNTKNYIEEIF